MFYTDKKMFYAWVAIALISGFLTTNNALSSNLCEKQFASFRNLVKIGTFRATSGLDAQTFFIFEKIRKNPYTVLSNNENVHLAEKGVLGLFRQWQQTNALVQKLNSEYAGWQRNYLKKPPNSLIQRALSFFGKAIFPYHTLVNRRSRIHKILKKIIINPDYELSSKEAEVILKKKLDADLLRFREDVKLGFGKKFAQINKIKSTAKVAMWSITVPTVALSLLGEEEISADASKYGPEGMSMFDDKVELIFLSPMPHASLRIGGIVYNYGVADVSRYNLETFHKMTGFGSPLSGNHTRIELKLTQDEIERLRDYLEADVGKIYPLVIPFVDCVSQTNKAIKYATGVDVPWVADRSKAMSIAYYKLRKLLGDERIGKIYHASDDRGLIVSKASEAAVNTLDSIFFLKRAGAVFLLAPILDSHPLTIDAPNVKVDVVPKK